jgi:hypothetical protein
MDAKMIFSQSKDGPILNQLPLPITPASIDHLMDLTLGHIAGDDTVQEPDGLSATDRVFEEWGNIDQSGGISDGMVLIFVLNLV